MSDGRGPPLSLAITWLLRLVGVGEPLPGHGDSEAAGVSHHRAGLIMGPTYAFEMIPRP